MQKQFNQVPYQIAFIDGIEIAGNNKEVPFIIVDEKNTSETPFLNNEVHDIKISMVDGSIWVENVGRDLISTFFQLPIGYTDLLKTEETINFAVVGESGVKFFFSINNIFKVTH
jgi:hypothetical protein